MDLLSAIIEGLITSGIFGLILLILGGKIRNWINKPFEKELAQFSSELDKVREQVNFKFTLFHQKKFDALSDAFAHLMSAKLEITAFVQVVINKEGLIKKFDSVAYEINCAKKAIHGASIFIDDSTYQRLSSVSGSFNPIMRKLAWSIQNEAEIDKEELTLHIAKLNNELELVEHEIRKELQQDVAMLKSKT